MKNEKVLVAGAGGFIGGHLVKRLKAEGFWVRGADLKKHEYSPNKSGRIPGRRSLAITSLLARPLRRGYGLSARRRYGRSRIHFTGEHDPAVMIIPPHQPQYSGVRVQGWSETLFLFLVRLHLSEHNQLDPDNPKCSEDSAYPAAPDSEYGWEKLFSERLYLSYMRNRGVQVRVARFHNIFGPEGTWSGGKRKLQRRSAERWLKRKLAGKSKFGAMAVRLAPSSTLTSVWKAFAVWWSQILRAR